MKIWIAFMLVWFALGARSARRGRPGRATTLLVACALVSFAYYSYRGV